MIELTINNVYHNELDGKPDEIEEYIKDYVQSVSLDDVIVSWEDTNSPIIVYFESESISIENYKIVVRECLRGFSGMVGGVDIDKSINDDNILIGYK